MIIIIIIINSVYLYYYYFCHQCYLEEKEKAMGWEGGFTNKTVVQVHMHVIFVLTFFYFCF